MGLLQEAHLYKSQRKPVNGPTFLKWGHTWSVYFGGCWKMKRATGLLLNWIQASKLWRYSGGNEKPREKQFSDHLGQKAQPLSDGLSRPCLQKHWPPRHHCTDTLKSLICSHQELNDSPTLFTRFLFLDLMCSDQESQLKKDSEWIFPWAPTIFIRAIQIMIEGAITQLCFLKNFPPVCEVLKPCVINAPYQFIPKKWRLQFESYFRYKFQMNCLIKH